MKMIQVDFRSDTLTKPTQAMMQTMINAPIGDDVFDEDPTVKELENYAANLFGKEAGLYCPSGTMTNQIAIKINTQPQDEVICHEHSHVYLYEGGGMAFNSAVSTRLVSGDRGLLTVDSIADAINPEAIYSAATKLVVLENTHNRGGGSCYELNVLQEISAFCKNKNLKLHLDGARICNAIVAKKYNAKDVGVLFETISVCLSKGLGAPVGSVLLASAEEIKKAKRVRKVFGGGMRQAGFIAAAGLYALQNNIERLQIDHDNATKLGEALQQASYIDHVMPIETNIVVYKLKDEINLENHLAALRNNGILAVQFGKQRVRMVTYYEITDAMMQHAVTIIKNL